MTVVWVLLAVAYLVGAVFMAGVARGLIEKSREDAVTLPRWPQLLSAVAVLLWPVFFAFELLKRLVRAGREAGRT